MELKPVTADDAEFLFDLLKQREGTVNISHKSLPDWKEHIQEYLAIWFDQSLRQNYLSIQ